MTREVADIVRMLGLIPHPEGGHYRETYRAAGMIPADALAGTHSGERAHSTAIYYLLAEGERSRLHRIASDELWHFYAGGPLEIVHVSPEGVLRRTILGTDLRAGHAPQHVIPRGTWFGATPLPGSGFSLAGCTVAPGFDFADFETGSREKLLEIYPGLGRLVAEWT